MDPADEDIEALARPEGRAGLSLGELLRLYLHPFALLKDVSARPLRLRVEALRYNRARRSMLLAYVQRWAVIAAVCLIAALHLAVRAEGPALGIAFVGADLGFAFALSIVLLAAAVYFLLGSEEPK